MVCSSMEAVAEPAWENSRLSSFELAVKRAVACLVAGLVSVVFLPVILLVAVAIKLDSPGPVLFTQDRVGKRGRRFRLFKFRSMRQDAEAVRASLMHLNEASGPVFKITNDPRVTRVGRALRKFSLDELPQLVNVIRGDMSLVGPRPLLMEYLPLYNAHQRRRHEVRPGITGWAQINGRNAISWKRKFDLDVWYVDNASFWLDLKILWLTLWHVLRREGISGQGSATAERFTGNRQQ